MPLALTTPVSSGDLDPSFAEYSQVSILCLNADLGERRRLVFQTQLGNTVSDKWFPGIATPRWFELDQAAFDALASSHTSNNGELTYAAVKRGLYEWLIAQGHYAGTIV